MRKYLHFLIYPALIIIPCVFFYKIFLGQSIIVGDLSGSDLLDLHYPLRFSVHKAITNGEIPLWEKNLTIGFPILAEGQVGVFYPANLLLSFLFNPIDSINFSILFVFIITLVSTYYYIKLITKKRLPSLFSALAFAFSAYFITRMKHLNIINSASLFPLLLLFSKKYFDTKKTYYTFLAALVIAAMIFSGHPQITFYNLFIFAIYCFFEMYRNYKKVKNNASVVARGITYLTLTVILGLAVSAIQILPTLEFINLSSRANLSKESLLAYPFHPKNLITFISPYYYGNPASGTYSENIRLGGIFWENASYFGMVPLVLSLIAIFYVLRKSNKTKNIYNKFFLFLAVFSALLMLGPFTPIFPTLTRNLPIFDLFRFPTRFNLYLIFSLSVLSASGFSLVLDKLSMMRGKSSKKHSDIDVKDQKKSGELKFNWPLNKKTTSAIIILFTLLDLYVFADAYIGYVPKDSLDKKPEYLNAIDDSKYFRLYSTTPYNPSPYSAIGWKKDIEAILDSRKAIPANNNILFDMPSFTDRDWFEAGPDILKRNDIENFLLYENTDPLNTSKILGMYSVKYILSFADYLGVEIYVQDEIELGSVYNIPLKLHRNDLAIPRAYITPEAILFNNPKELFEKIKSSDFLPTKTVLLEDKPSKLPEKFKGSLEKFGEENTAEIVKNTDTEVEIAAKIKTHSFLVLNDIYYPGWKAKVNGEEVKILRANYIVRALELEPGEHEIKFYYDPLPFKIGVVISSLTLLAITAISVTVVGKKFFKRQ